MNIYLDIDDVIFDFQRAYAERFKTKQQKNWSKSNLMIRRLNILKQEPEFWLNLPIKNKPNFIPSGFVSARSIDKNWTYNSLSKHEIPSISNIHQVPWNVSKIDTLKSLKCHIFIDDKYETFKECNKNGVFCLLMDASHNQKYKTKHRIYDLDINNIIQKYESLCHIK